MTKKKLYNKYNEELDDIDDNTSHVEGSTAVMSAGESESESETDIVEVEPEISETPYIPQVENEFGAVSFAELCV